MTRAARVASQDRLVTFTPLFRSQIFGVVASPDVRDYASLSDVFDVDGRPGEGGRVDELVVTLEDGDPGARAT